MGGGISRVAKQSASRPYQKSIRIVPRKPIHAFCQCNIIKFLQPSFGGVRSIRPGCFKLRLLFGITWKVALEGDALIQSHLSYH